MLVLDENILSSSKEFKSTESDAGKKNESWYKLCCFSIQCQSAINYNVLFLLAFIEYLQLLGLVLLQTVLLTFR